MGFKEIFAWKELLYMYKAKTQGHCILNLIDFWFDFVQFYSLGIQRRLFHVFPENIHTYPFEVHQKMLRFVELEGKGRAQKANFVIECQA